MPTVKRNDVEIYYEVRGDGPPLLLIPGLASDSQSWLSVIGDLEKRFRVIALDNRGSGRTTPMDTETGIELMADDCAALLDALQIPAAHILGHSMGGFIAQDLAIRHPGRVDRLVLVASVPAVSRRVARLFNDMADAYEEALAITPRTPEDARRRVEALSRWFRNIFYWIFSDRFFEQDQIVKGATEFSVGYPFPQSVLAFRRQVETCNGFRTEANLERIRAKTLVLAGGRDPLFPRDACEAFARRIPAATFAAIPEAAHSVHVDCPGEFVEQVTAFLSS